MEIQERFARNKMIKLPEGQNFNLERYFDFIQDNIDDLMVNRQTLKVAFFITEFDDIGEVIRMFRRYNAIFQQYSDILEVTLPYEYFDKKYKMCLHAYFKKEEKLLILFGVGDSTEFKEIDKIINNTRGIYYLWISPKSFDEVKNHILSHHPESKIPEFWAKRSLIDKHECNIRPGYDRTFHYFGDDGRDTLEELKYYYGVLPTSIKFKIPKKVTFLVTNKGKFTLESRRKNSLSYFSEIMEIVLKEALYLRGVIEKCKFDLGIITTAKKEIKVPIIESGTINLTNPINAKYVESVIKELRSKEKFVITDKILAEGSLLFSATLIDESKKTIFDISARTDSITLVPKFNPSFDSLFRFYRFIVENIDSEAELIKS